MTPKTQAPLPYRQSETEEPEYIYQPVDWLYVAAGVFLIAVSIVGAIAAVWLLVGWLA